MKVRLVQASNNIENLLGITDVLQRDFFQAVPRAVLWDFGTPRAAWGMDATSSSQSADDASGVDCQSVPLALKLKSIQTPLERILNHILRRTDNVAQHALAHVLRAPFLPSHKGLLTRRVK